ncbi:MAG: hypothetical protein H6718_22475 [Polyangiaceae bacterium]|nr:hypothetical protein [Myxococcales bacterium]MCB9588191.1 hypothetical protein [Polyangiaceae bacterium]
MLPNRWQIAKRKQEFRGESFANLARASAVLAFYVIEIINHHGSRALGMPSVVGRDMHAMVTALVGSWVGAALLTVVVMRLRYFPIWLKYLTTSIDLAMMTAVLAVLDGPKSPMLIGFFLVLALSATRFSQRLIACTGAGTLVCYGVLLWHTAVLRPALAVPRYHQLIFGLAVVILSGVLIVLINAAERLFAAVDSAPNSTFPADLPMADSGEES